MLGMTQESTVLADIARCSILMHCQLKSTSTDTVPYALGVGNSKHCVGILSVGMQL